MGLAVVAAAAGAAATILLQLLSAQWQKPRHDLTAETKSIHIRNRLN